MHWNMEWISCYQNAIKNYGIETYENGASNIKFMKIL